MAGHWEERPIGGLLNGYLGLVWVKDKEELAMEIQKAEEFAHDVAKSVSDAIHTPIVLDILGSAADLVRARDKAIIERCKEAIHAEDWRGACGKGPAIDEALDSILRDLD
jgi:hypothetical protein